MAIKIGSKVVFHPTKETTPNNSRITEQQKEFLEFMQQYVVLEDGKQVYINETQLEDELGLDYGQLEQMHLACRKAIDSAGSYSAGLLVAMLFGMWAVQTKWEHIEEKPIVVTE